MSAAAELLAELTVARVELRAVGGRLHFVAPVGVLTPEVLGKLREHKPALLELLTSTPAPEVEDAPEVNDVGAPEVVTEDAPERTCRCGGRIVHDVNGRPLCTTCDGLPAGFGAHTCGPTLTKPAVLAEVARIAPDALRLGWLDADLWGTCGWFHVRGLVAFVHGGDRVGSIDPHGATIVRKSGAITRWSRCTLEARP